MTAFARWVAALMSLGVIASAEVIRFYKCTPGKPPPGWTVAMTHEGGAPEWQVRRDDTAPSPPYVLAQTSRDKTAGRFPLAIWEGASILNGETGVAFKKVSGVID